MFLYFDCYYVSCFDSYCLLLVESIRLLVESTVAIAYDTAKILIFLENEPCFHTFFRKICSYMAC